MTEIKSGYKPKPKIDDLLSQYQPYTEFWKVGEGMGAVSTLLFELIYYCESAGYLFDEHLSEAKENLEKRKKGIVK